MRNNKIGNFENFLNEDLNDPHAESFRYATSSEQEKTTFKIKITDNFIKEIKNGKFIPKKTKEFTVKLFKNEQGKLISNLINIGTIIFPKKPNENTEMTAVGFVLYYYDDNLLGYYISKYVIWKNADEQQNAIDNQVEGKWGGEFDEFDLEDASEKELSRRGSPWAQGDFKSDEPGAIDNREFFEIISSS